MTAPVDPERPRKPRSADIRGFDQKLLDRTVIAIPLLDAIAAAKPEDVIDVVIDLNLTFPGGRERARERVRDLVAAALAPFKGKVMKAIRRDDPNDPDPFIGVDVRKSELSDQYVFASLPADAIKSLVRLDALGGKRANSASKVIYRVWPDFPLQVLLTSSVRTVKADAALTAFAAAGRGIVWAVLDTGIDGDHPHFRRYKNLELPAPLRHRDFSTRPDKPEAALTDVRGHGTHVAGIIGGDLRTTDVANASAGGQILAVARHRNEDGTVVEEQVTIDNIRGVAPECKIVSMKILGDDGKGAVSNAIAALEEINRINGYGKELRIHGVNMSVGYAFDPKWFACGQSPLCTVVDRLARTGVVIVVAAGNTGFGNVDPEMQGPSSAGLSLTINDPGNAELAITVGATHREMPHLYGVSYFSSKGPTGDGRLKPDLVAPGEKVLSCLAKPATPAEGPVALYAEQSGTSMAAPHVSGAIAAFLSIRREFIGRATEVKRVFMTSATDLGREKYFQGAGLVDLMRAVQSV